MKRYENERLRIQKNLRGVRDPEIRRKARALIVVLESSSIRKGCDSIGLTRQTLYEWLNRLKNQDFDIQALAAQSRRPKNSPRKTSEAIEQKIEALHKVHGHSDRLLKLELQEELDINLSHSGICKILKRRNCVRLYKTPKPNSFKKRYSMPNALDRTQSDTLWTGLTDNHGHRVYMAGIIDDCTRRAFGELYDEVSSCMTVATARMFFEQVGVPKKSQTDGGTEFTNLYTSLLNPRREKKATLGAFELLLQEYRVEHRITKARTPQHNGKIERFNQTVLKEFSSRVPDGLALAEYRRLFSAYLDYYNNKRRHSSINYLTPVEAFQKHPPLAA